jgi:hypothetical protein
MHRLAWKRKLFEEGRQMEILIVVDQEVLKRVFDWGCDSVEEHLCSMHKAMGSIPNMAKINKQINK